MFADDTNLFFKHQNLITLCNIVNTELIKIWKWFKLYTLSLNVKKPIILFSIIKTKLLFNVNLVLQTDNVIIKQVNSCKFLGVIINSNLTWQDHIETVCKKISKSIGIILTIRKNVPNDVLITLYHTLVIPYFSYCNILWASHDTSYLNCLFIKQKKAIRIITNSKFSALTKLLFQRLNLLNIYESNKIQTCFMYKILNNILPSYFVSLFTTNLSIHDHFTRQASKFHMTSHHTNVRAYSIQVYGTKFWNSLSKDITVSASLSIFKKQCIEFMHKAT